MTERRRVIKTLQYMATYGMFEQVYKDGLMAAIQMLEEDEEKDENGIQGQSE